MGGGAGSEEIQFLKRFFKSWKAWKMRYGETKPTIIGKIERGDWLYRPRPA